MIQREQNSTIEYQSRKRPLRAVKSNVKELKVIMNRLGRMSTTKVRVSFFPLRSYTIPRSLRYLTSLSTKAFHFVKESP